MRSRWVPAYVKHVFSAGMSTSSRAEGDNAFFKTYCVCVYKATERRKDGSLKVREVTVDKVADKVACSCKKFEFEGILCRHILACMKWKQIEYLPDQYILKWWTRTTSSDLVVEEHGKYICDFGDDSLLTRQTILSKVVAELIVEALVSKEACKLLEENFESMRKKIKSVVDRSTNVRDSEENATIDSCGGCD
ncbi:hypothetical protein ACLB2K_006100 [Fragaria x ananassa]